MRPSEPALVLLQAVAVVGAVTVAVLDPGPSPAAVPALALFFAATAARSAAALERLGSGRAFLRTRLLPVLLPLWVFAACVVPLMAVRGWVVDPYAGGTPLTWGEAWRWVLPLTAPPTSVEGFPWAGTAWVAGTLALLVLLTPATAWLVARWPARVLTVPVVTTALVTVGLANPVGADRDLAVQLGVHGSAWVLGLAWHGGALRVIPTARAVLVGGALLTAALGGVLWRGVDVARATVGEVPLLSLLAAVGVVLVAARLPIDGGWVHRRRVAGGPVAALGNRAVTVLLWVNLVLAFSPAALASSPLAPLNTADAAGTALRLAAVWVLLGVVVVALGWVEDVGAGRRPSLSGRGRRGMRSSGQFRPAYRLEGNMVALPLEGPAVGGRAPAEQDAADTSRP